MTTEAKRMIRMMATEIEVDVAQRILKRATIVTRGIASDGGIVDPAGIVVRFYQENPQVLAMHGFITGEHSPVIGRSLGLVPTAFGMESQTQFADTELGREYAYLYGVNEKKEVYSRGWSFGWNTTEIETWPLAKARAWLGADYNEDLLPRHVRERGEVWVAKKSVMNEYSAVAMPADRKALSRAMADGIRTAAALVSEIDLSAALAAIAELRETHLQDQARIARLEREVLALQGDGAGAALRGDTSAILAELDAWKRELK